MPRQLPSSTLAGAKSNFYKISATEVLPRDDLRTGIPIILDEFMPMLPRGCNPPHTIDEMKILTDVEQGGSIHGKGSNSKTTGVIHFEKHVPRIITCNAATPHEFIDIIPRDIYTMTNDERKSLSNNALAILKRCAFFDVQHSLIPDAVKASYKAASSNETVERFEEIFGGLNAIP